MQAEASRAWGNGLVDAGVVGGWADWSLRRQRHPRHVASERGGLLHMLPGHGFAVNHAFRIHFPTALQLYAQALQMVECARN